MSQVLQRRYDLVDTPDIASPSEAYICIQVLVRESQRLGRDDTTRGKRSRK